MLKLPFLRAYKTRMDGVLGVLWLLTIRMLWERAWLRDGALAEVATGVSPNSTVAGPAPAITTPPSDLRERSGHDHPARTGSLDSLACFCEDIHLRKSARLMLNMT